MEEKKDLEKVENRVEYNSEEFDKKIESLREDYSKIQKQLETLEASLSSKIKDDILSKIFVKKDEDKKDNIKKEEEEILEDF